MTKTAKDLQNYLKEKDKSRFPVDDETIEEVVKKTVDLSNDTRNGWHPVYCAVCGDGSRTKGPRGGWFFEGENARYNCFNCGIKGAFTPDEEIPMSRDMKEVFKSFGIPKREYAKILFRIRDQDKGFKPAPKKEARKDPLDALREKSFPVPDYLQPLEEVLDTKLGYKCLEILERKMVSYKDYPFFVSKGKTESGHAQEKINAKITVNRLVIPIMIDDRVILLQARDLYGKSKNKYINIGNISNCLYGVDRLKENHKYIFVTEGFWDAYHLNGVATITNQLTNTQANILNAIDKPKVVVPDRQGDYNTLAMKAIDKYGWGISAPREFRNYKDVTEATKKYGKLYTTHIFMKAAVLGDKAKLIVKSL